MIPQYQVNYISEGSVSHINGVWPSFLTMMALFMALLESEHKTSTKLGTAKAKRKCWAKWTKLPAGVMGRVPSRMTVWFRHIEHWKSPWNPWSIATILNWVDWLKVDHASPPAKKEGNDWLRQHGGLFNNTLMVTVGWGGGRGGRVRKANQRHLKNLRSVWSQWAPNLFYRYVLVCPP